MTARLKYVLLLSLMMPIALSSAKPTQVSSLSQMRSVTHLASASLPGSLHAGTDHAVAVLQAASNDVLGAQIVDILNESVDHHYVINASVSDDSSISFLDVALMFLFSVGVLAYPLVRKQRILDSSISP